MGVKPLAILLSLGLHLGTALGQSIEDLQAKGWQVVTPPNIIINIKETRFNAKALNIIVPIYIQPQDYNKGYGSGAGYVSIHCKSDEQFDKDLFSNLDKDVPLQKLSALDNALLTYELCIRQ